MAKQKDLKAVLFDFDGTLMHLPINYQRMRNRLKELFTQFNIYSDFHPLMESIELSLGELGAKASPEVVKQIREEAFAIIEEEELQAIENARMAEGAGEVLLSLKKSGITIAVVSRNGRNCIQRCLSRFSLPQPDLIVAREDVKQLKPHPEHFRLALEKLGVKPSQAIVIGDSYHDIDGGKKLGIETILIAQDVFEEQIKPDFKIKRLSEILGTLPLRQDAEPTKC